MDYSFEWDEQRSAEFMKKEENKVKQQKNDKIVEGSFGAMEEIADFLPRPEELVFRPKGVKVTITLSEDSVNYFKEHAEQLQTSYQRMMRNLIDEYVRRMRDREHKATLRDHESQ
jgi:predicted DNA binding CopG/RHH family protein